MSQKSEIKGSLLKDALKEKKTGNLLIDLEVLETKFSRKIPESCSNCGSSDFFGLEILGAGTGVLYWDCKECDTKTLRYSKRTTLRYLKEANELFSSPSDWDNFPYQEEN